MEAYEDTFDKKPFMLMLNMEFLRNPETHQSFDFLSVTKYSGILDRAAHDKLKEELIQKHFGSVPINFGGLSLTLPTDDPGNVIDEGVKQQQAPTHFGDEYDALDSALTPATSGNKSPLVASGRILDSHLLLQETLEKDPEKLRQMALKLMKTGSSDAIAIQEMKLDQDKEKEQFYHLLEKPEYEGLYRSIKKTLVKENLLRQLVAFEPDVVIKMLCTDLSNQLVQKHQPAQAEQLNNLLSTVRGDPNPSDKLMAFLDQEEHGDIRYDLQLTIDSYYLSAISHHLIETEQRIEDVSQDELLKSLNACEVMELLYDDTLLDKPGIWGSYDHDEDIIEKTSLIKKQRLLEAELAWRFTKSEQFSPSKDRLYMLASPSRQDFIKKATSEKWLSPKSRNRLDQWFSTWCNEKLQDTDALIFDNIAQHYLPSLRKYHSAPYHENLAKLQQSRYDLLTLQKNYVYSEALKLLEGKHKGTLLSDGNIEDYKNRLKAIDIQQKATAPSRPTESFLETLGGSLQKFTGGGENYSLNTMLDDIEWRQSLLDLDYNYQREFERRTGIPVDSYWRSFKHKLGLNKPASPTDQQLDEAAKAITTEKEAIKKQIEGFIDKTLRNLDEVREVGRKNPLLFRKTFGEIASILPTIAEHLGYQDLTGSPMMQNFQAQNFASEFIGNPEEDVRKEREPLTDKDKEWIKSIQFTHDTALNFLEGVHRFNIIKAAGSSALKQGATLGAMASIIAGPLGAVAGTATGVVSGVMTGVSTAISPKASKAMIDRMSSQALEFTHCFAGSGTSQFMGQWGRVLGHVAEQAPNLMSNQSNLKKLFFIGKIAASTILKPVTSLKTQFKAINKAFWEARQGKVGGWSAFTMEVLPVAAIIIGGICAATAAAVSVALTFGLTLGVFTAALGAFAAASCTLSGVLLNSKYSDRLTSDAYAHFQEQYFRPDSTLALKVKKQCRKDAERLFAGQLMKHEAYQQLEQQEVLRSYYHTYWQKYCQQQLNKHELDQDILKAFEQQCDQEFDQWIKKTKINKRAKDISVKMDVLKDLDLFLSFQDTPARRNILEGKLKQLGIIEQLPDQKPAYFIRMIRDEINEYIHLECGEFPRESDPDVITQILTERCRQAFLGYKVKKALDPTHYPELKSFESTAKKLLRKNHCQRIAACAESHIKAIITEPMKELPLPPPVSERKNEEPEINVSEQSLDDAMDAGLDAVEELLSEDEFFDALEEQPPEVDSDIDTEEIDNAEETIVAPTLKPAPEKVVRTVSYDQMREKLQSGFYLGTSGVSELIRDLMQIDSQEDLIKINLISGEELAKIQQTLKITDEDIHQLQQFMIRKLALKIDPNANQKRMAIPVPKFMQTVLGKA